MGYSSYASLEESDGSDSAPIKPIASAQEVRDYINNNQDTPTPLIVEWILKNTNASKEVAESATLMWAMGDHSWFNDNF